MAARKRTWTPEIVRERIRTSMLINRLQDHVDGKIELSPTQVQAATVLLRKVVPDTTSSSVTVTHRARRLSYAERLAQAPAARPAAGEATSNTVQ